MRRERIAQGVQRAFERKAGGASPGRLHGARATHRDPCERAPGTERTGVNPKGDRGRYFAGPHVADLQGVDVGCGDVDRIPFNHSKPGAGALKGGHKQDICD